MANDDTLAQALASVRQQRERIEADYERLGAELSKLRLAEQSLASIVEGISLDEPVGVSSQRRRAGGSEDQPRANRGPRGPRANSAKGRLKALLEDAGRQGLSHSQISERLHDVSPNTLATYLSMMTSSGELERDGDFFRAGTSPVQNHTSGRVAEGDQDSDSEAESNE